MDISKLKTCTLVAIVEQSGLELMVSVSLSIPIETAGVVIDGGGVVDQLIVYGHIYYVCAGRYINFFSFKWDRVILILILL